MFELETSSYVTHACMTMKDCAARLRIRSAGLDSFKSISPDKGDKNELEMYVHVCCVLNVYRSCVHMEV
jgi:hypothetical protein